MSDRFPLTVQGGLHLGIHRNSDIVQPLVWGKICAYRLSNNYTYIPPPPISTEDFLTLPEDQKKLYGQSGMGYGPLNKSAPQSSDLMASILNRLGIVSSNDFFLVEHRVLIEGTSRENNEKFLVFYTLYMHLEPCGTVLESNKNWIPLNTANYVAPFYLGPQFRLLGNAYRTMPFITINKKINTTTNRELDASLIFPQGLMITIEKLIFLNGTWKYQVLLPPELRNGREGQARLGEDERIILETARVNLGSSPEELDATLKADADLYQVRNGAGPFKIASHPKYTVKMSRATLLTPLVRNNSYWYSIKGLGNKSIPVPAQKSATGYINVAHLAGWAQRKRGQLVFSIEIQTQLLPQANNQIMIFRLAKSFQGPPAVYQHDASTFIEPNDQTIAIERATSLSRHIMDATRDTSGIHSFFKTTASERILVQASTLLRNGDKVRLDLDPMPGTPALPATLLIPIAKDRSTTVLDTYVKVRFSIQDIDEYLVPFEHVVFSPFVAAIGESSQVGTIRRTIIPLFDSSNDTRHMVDFLDAEKDNKLYFESTHHTSLLAKTLTAGAIMPIDLFSNDGTHRGRRFMGHPGNTTLETRLVMRDIPGYGQLSVDGKIHYSTRPTTSIPVTESSIIGLPGTSGRDRTTHIELFMNKTQDLFGRLNSTARYIPFKDCKGVKTIQFPTARTLQLRPATRLTYAQIASAIYQHDSSNVAVMISHAWAELDLLQANQQRTPQMKESLSSVSFISKKDEKPTEDDESYGVASPLPSGLIPITIPDIGNRACNVSPASILLASITELHGGTSGTITLPKGTTCYVGTRKETCTLRLNNSLVFATEKIEQDGVVAWKLTLQKATIYSYVFTTVAEKQTYRITSSKSAFLGSFNLNTKGSSQEVVSTYLTNPIVVAHIDSKSWPYSGNHVDENKAVGVVIHFQDAPQQLVLWALDGDLKKDFQFTAAGQTTVKAKVAIETYTRLFTSNPLNQNITSLEPTGEEQKNLHLTESKINDDNDAVYYQLKGPGDTVRYISAETRTHALESLIETSRYRFLITLNEQERKGTILDTHPWIDCTHSSITALAENTFEVKGETSPVHIPCYDKPPQMVIASSGQAPLPLDEVLCESACTPSITFYDEAGKRFVKNGAAYAQFDQFSNDYRIFDQHFLRLLAKDLSSNLLLRSDLIEKIIDAYQKSAQAANRPDHLSGKTKPADWMASNSSKLAFCGYEFPSQWMDQEGDRLPAYGNRSAHQELIKLCAIWSGSTSNPSLPEPIRNGNELIFFHPEHFITHLQAADLLTSNPYAGEILWSRADSESNPNRQGEAKQITVVSNPGFAPVVNYQSDYVHNGIYYAPVTGLFDQDYQKLDYYFTSHDAFWHKGVDFGAGAGSSILSFIHGTVIGSGWFRDGYGQVMLIGDNSQDLIYMLAHLQEVLLADGAPVVPGTLVALVGGSGYDPQQTKVEDKKSQTRWKPHLHLEVLRSPRRERNIFRNHPDDNSFITWATGDNSFSPHSIRRDPFNNEMGPPQGDIKK